MSLIVLQLFCLPQDEIDGVAGIGVATAVQAGEKGQQGASVEEINI